MAKIIVKPVNRENMPEMVRVLSHAFCRYEATTKPLKPNETEYAARLSKIVLASINDGFSCVVYDAETGKVIGGTLASRESSNIMHGVTYKALLPLDELTAPAYVEDADPSTVLAIYMIGALPVADGGRKGVTQAVLAFMLEAAKAKGMKYVTAQLTSPITQHIFFNKFGFKPEGDLLLSQCGIEECKNEAGNAIYGVLDVDTYKKRSAAPAA